VDFSFGWRASDKGQDQTSSKERAISESRIIQLHYLAFYSDKQRGSLYNESW